MPALNGPMPAVALQDLLVSRQSSCFTGDAQGSLTTFFAALFFDRMRLYHERLTHMWKIQILVEFLGHPNLAAFNTSVIEIIADYTQALFKSDLPLDVVCLPPVNYLQLPTTPAPFDFIYRSDLPRLAVQNVFHQSHQQYGYQQAFTDVSERFTRYQEWGIMNESNLHRSSPPRILAHEMALDYIQNPQSRWCDFRVLLSRWVKRIQQQRPHVQKVITNIETSPNYLITEEKLGLVVTQVLRPLGIQGQITFNVFSRDEHGYQEDMTVYTYK